MASCSPPLSPVSASTSQNSATRPVSPNPLKPQVDAAINNCVPNVQEKNPEGTDSILSLDSAEYLEKYKKYETDYVRRLQAKYFSKNNIYGGNIFDEKMTIKDEIIKSSRWPSTRSFADPVRGFEDLLNSSSIVISAPETNFPAAAGSGLPNTN